MPCLAAFLHPSLIVYIRLDAAAVCRVLCRHVGCASMYTRPFTGWLLLLPVTACTQVLRQPAATQYTSLCALSRHQADVFSRMHNQAALAEASTVQAGIYGERRYQLTELGNYAAAMVLPTTRGNVGVQLRYAGFPFFNETQLAIAYARPLGKAVSVGIQVNHFGYRAGGYGRAATLNTEIGALLRLSPALSLGMHVFNPVGGRFAKTGEKLPQVISLALGYDASESVFVGAELKKEAWEQVQFHAGFQYRFAHRFFVRGGLNTSTGSGMAGAGVAWNSFRLDITGSHHPQLGWSPGILLLFGLNPPSGHP